MYKRQTCYEKGEKKYKHDVMTYGFKSDNEVTGKQFEEIRAKLNEYVASVRPL